MFCQSSNGPQGVSVDKHLQTVSLDTLAKVMCMIADKSSGASSVPKHRLQGWNSAKEGQWRHWFELCFLPMAAAPNLDSYVEGGGKNRYSQGTVRLPVAFGTRITR